MSDYATAMQQALYYQTFVANTNLTTVTVSITNGSANATLSAAHPSLTKNCRYNITATGIPAGANFVYTGTTAIVLSANATATNATAAATIYPTPVVH